LGGCGCAYQPLPRAISVLAMSKDNPNSPPIAHTSHTVNLGSTLNFQRRSDTNNLVCRLFNRGRLQCKFGKKTANIHTDVQNAMEITQLQIVD
jgi:hypothetical protein